MAEPAELRIYQPSCVLSQELGTNEFRIKGTCIILQTVNLVIKLREENGSLTIGFTATPLMPPHVLNALLSSFIRYEKEILHFLESLN